LHYKLILLLLEFWPLTFHNIDKELVLQTVWCDREVDDSHLNANFWQIVRIWQLGGDQEAEVPRVGHRPFSKSDLPCACPLDHILLQDWLEGGIKGFAYIL
jgi:hypothetical protein